MLTYYDSQNNPVRLLKELGRGGEGAVYSCADDALVGKIYHEKIADEKAEKLLWMAENSTPQLLKTTAWVAEVLREKPDGKIVGFLMPKIRAKEIHELYAPKSRRVHFPDATWHFLIHTATNLARAFHNLHKDGHVMGDVNQGNCVVTHDGTVKLIDCDSYGIKTADKAYACEVGVTTHIPPELQGKNLRNVVRTENHDNFGLAVIIFQLVFLGRHPFAGNYLGAEDKTLEEAIRQHLFVYGKDAEEKRVVRPPGTLPLAAASPTIAELFERAFASANARPEPREWVEALEQLAASLQQCLLNPGHVFYSKFTSEFALCPWCEIESNTGLMLFPFNVSTNALNKTYEREFDVVTIEKLIESFNISALPTTLSSALPPVYPEPSPEVVKERQRLDKMFGISLGIAPVLPVISYLFDLPFVVYLAVVIILCKVVFEEPGGKKLRSKEREKFAELQLQHDYLESVFEKTARTTGVNKQLFQIQQALREYGSLESDFAQSKSAAENSAMTDGIAGRMERARKKVTDMLVSLRAASVEARRQQQKIIAQGKDSLKAFLQAKANVNHLSYNFKPAAIPFEYLPQGVLVGSMIIFVMLPPFSSPAKKSEIRTVKPVSYGASSEPPPVAPPLPMTTVPPESITDKEIAALTDTKRNLIVSELLNKVNYAGGYNDKEKLLKFARRFDKNNVEVLNRLGEASYNLGNYKQALDSLESVRRLDSRKTNEFYLGMTYLQLERYNEAKGIFTKLNAASVTTQGLYNLGTANMGLKDYKTAAENYNAILKISPGDTDAMYQLGICYARMGDKEGVKQTYATLKAFNSNRANELRNAVSKTVNLDSVPTDYSSTRGVGTGNGESHGIGNGIPDEDEPPPAPPVPSSRSN